MSARGYKWTYITCNSIKLDYLNGMLQNHPERYNQPKVILQWHPILFRAELICKDAFDLEILCSILRSENKNETKNLIETQSNWKNDICDEFGDFMELENNVTDIIEYSLEVRNENVEWI